MYDVIITEEHLIGVLTKSGFSRHIPCTRSDMRNILWLFFIKNNVVNVSIIDHKTGELMADIQENGEMYFNDLCREV